MCMLPVTCGRKKNQPQSSIALLGTIFFNSFSLPTESKGRQNIIRSEDETITRPVAGGVAARIDPALPLCHDFTPVVLI